MRRAVPDITDWHVQSWENDWPEERPILFVDDKRFENTSFEDVEAALDGVDGGDYGSFFLMFPGGYDATSPSTAGKGTTMWWKPPCLTRTGTSGSPHRAGLRFSSGFQAITKNQGFPIWKNGKTSPKK